MSEKHRCCGVGIVRGKTVLCAKHGKYEVDGKRYCNYHRPDREAERIAAVEAWNEESRRMRQFRQEQQERQQKWERDCKAALVDVADPIAWVEEAKRMLKTAGLLNKLDVYANTPPAPHGCGTSQDASGG